MNMMNINNMIKFVKLYCMGYLGCKYNIYSIDYFIDIELVFMKFLFFYKL